MDILEKLGDLHKQATEERSHFYTGKVILEAIHEISTLRRKISYTSGAEKPTANTARQVPGSEQPSTQICPNCKQEKFVDHVHVTYKKCLHCHYRE